MASRTAHRLRVLARAALGALRSRPETRPAGPRAVLVLHELLLGDTLMLAPLLAALRARYPEAALYVTAPPALLPLFSGRPYGAQPLAFSERDPHALERLAPAKNCDIAFIPGDNFHALTARAIGARWVVAFARARPGWKNRFTDEAIAFPERPTALGEIFGSLARYDGPLRYRAGDWPAPAFTPFATPSRPYAVLHVGARSPLRFWPADRWATLADKLAQRGYTVVWSAGAAETALIGEIDPEKRFESCAGKLDLAQLWHLIAGSELLVTLDTGIAHLAKLTGTRTLCLFGPGSAPLLGRGEFWRDSPFTGITVANFPCRDQRMLFKREVHWVRHCARTPAQCSRGRCMEALTVEDALAALPA